MPYDEHLADRVRDLLIDHPDVTAKRMFGGLAFVVADHMAVAARSDGGLMVRVDPARMSDILATGDARPANASATTSAPSNAAIAKYERLLDEPSS